MIDQQTLLYAVVGWPTGPSLSPIMHNAAFAAAGINAVYLAFPVRDIPGCMAGVRALGIRGLSVTIPHKAAVIPHLDDLDERAREIGAVNTVANREGRVIGYNTDAAGALKALEERCGRNGTDTDRAAWKLSTGTTRVRHWGRRA